MFVCSCNALREAALRDVARSGIKCEREAFARLGCEIRCGRCIPYARQLVRPSAPEKSEAA